MERHRFQKKVVNAANSLPVHQLLVALLRLRVDDKVSDSVLCKRVTKRLCHIWAQACTSGMTEQFQTSCPDCTLSAKYHPFQRSSRAKGNKSLQLSLVSKFQARSGGYVTLKSEDTLRQLGLVSKDSKLGGKTGLEYCARLLAKTAKFVQDQVASGERVLNFCFDSAFVGEENVFWPDSALKSIDYEALSLTVMYGIVLLSLNLSLMCFQQKIVYCSQFPFIYVCTDLYH